MQKQKPYKVIQTAGAPVFDSLPVSKITHYPLEKRDYKPFAQCNLALGGDRLYLRLWAFEVSPMPTSALGCVLYLYPDTPERALALWIQHESQGSVSTSVACWENGKELTPTPTLQARIREQLECAPHNGEDLQGVYWGMSLSLPLALVEELGGAVSLAAGEHFPGNFYKTCSDQRFAHAGSSYPANFPDDPYGRDSMGLFQVASCR